MKNKQRKRGFTLVELMIVVVIVGILASIGVPIYRTYTRKAMAAEGRSLVGAISSAERVYYAENGQYYLVPAPTSFDTTISVDARGNKYFQTYTVTGQVGGPITITATGSGGAAGITVSGTMSPTQAITITETGI